MQILYMLHLRAHLRSPVSVARGLQITFKQSVFMTYLHNKLKVLVPNVHYCSKFKS